MSLLIVRLVAQNVLVIGKYFLEFDGWKKTDK